MATKVVIDSAAAADAIDAIRRIADAVSSGGILADLAWTRLTRWRETLARVFENRDTLARLTEVDSVRVRFGPSYETAAWYLAAWAANALASVGQVVTPVVGRQSNCTNLPRPADYHLMREELGIMRRDAIFEDALASAARLAVSSSSGQI
jgi:glucose-6-phosphate dehydrogenase assembly protein OpcA